MLQLGKNTEFVIFLIEDLPKIDNYNKHEF